MLTGQTGWPPRPPCHLTKSYLKEVAVHHFVVISRQAFQALPAVLLPAQVPS